MLKRIISIAAISTFMITAGAAFAYPQTTLFGTGYGFAGYNNFNNGAAQAGALNEKPKNIEVKKNFDGTIEATTETLDENAKSAEKNVSDINRKYDESPNAGYKTNYRYIEKDMSDYNPNTGAGSGVNSSKSIYKDNLGRLHFFGKNNQIKESEQ